MFDALGDGSVGALLVVLDPLFAPQTVVHDRLNQALAAGSGVRPAWARLAIALRVVALRASFGEAVRDQVRLVDAQSSRRGRGRRFDKWAWILSGLLESYSWRTYFAL